MPSTTSSGGSGSAAPPGGLLEVPDVHRRLVRLPPEPEVGRARLGAEVPAGGRRIRGTQRRHEFGGAVVEPGAKSVAVLRVRPLLVRRPALDHGVAGPAVDAAEVPGEILHVPAGARWDGGRQVGAGEDRGEAGGLALEVVHVALRRQGHRRSVHLRPGCHSSCRGSHTPYAWRVVTSRRHPVSDEALIDRLLTVPAMLLVAVLVFVVTIIVAWNRYTPAPVPAAPPAPAAPASAPPAIPAAPHVGDAPAAVGYVLRPSPGRSLS